MLACCKSIDLLEGKVTLMDPLQLQLPSGLLSLHELNSESLSLIDCNSLLHLKHRPDSKVEEIEFNHM